MPPYSLSIDIQDEISRKMIEVAKEIGVVGLANAWFAVKSDDICVLEVNPCASQTISFVSKVAGVPLAKIGARVMVGGALKEEGIAEIRTPSYYSVKESVFPFAKAFAGGISTVCDRLLVLGDVVFISFRDVDKQKAAEIGIILNYRLLYYCYARYT